MSLFGGGARKARLVLHVGLDGTHVEAVQRTLVAHRADFAAAGLVYPTAGMWGGGHDILPLHCGFKPGPPPSGARAPDDLVATWAKEIAAHPGAMGLVSLSSIVGRGDAKRLVDLLEPAFQLQMVIYLRRHDLWLPALYERLLRDGPALKCPRGYEAFVKYDAVTPAPGANFRTVVDTWAQRLGKPQVVVRPFEAAQVGPNVLADLLKVADAPAAAQALAVRALEHVPVPLSFEALTFIDVVRRTRLTWALQQRLVKRMIETDPGTTRGVTMASQGLRAGQIAAHFDEYEYLAHRFLGREDGQMFLEPTPSDETVPWKAPAPPSFMWMTERLCEYLGTGDDAIIDGLREWARASAERAPAA